MIRLALDKPSETAGVEAARLALLVGRRAALRADRQRKRRSRDASGADRARAQLHSRGRFRRHLARTRYDACARPAPRRHSVDGHRLQRLDAAASRSPARNTLPRTAEADRGRRALLRVAGAQGFRREVRPRSAAGDDARRQDASAAHDARRPRRRRRRPDAPCSRARAAPAISPRAPAPTSDPRSPRSATSCRRAALLLAILDPSAGIAFGYEGWSDPHERRPAAHRSDHERDGRRAGDEAHRRDPAPRAEEHHHRTEAHGRVAHAAGSGAHDDGGGPDEPRRVSVVAAQGR